MSGAGSGYDVYSNSWSQDGHLSKLNMQPKPLTVSPFQLVSVVPMAFFSPLRNRFFLLFLLRMRIPVFFGSVMKLRVPLLAIVQIALLSFQTRELKMKVILQIMVHI
jgi:hypothetical protein